MCWASNHLQSHYHSLKEVIEKVFKSMLCSLLGKDIHVVQQLTASTNPKVVIINGVAVLHMIKSCGADTFGELFENLQYLTLLQQQSASPRGLWPILKSEVLPLLSVQWQKCISNPKEKVWLECFPPLISSFIAGNWTFTLDQFLTWMLHFWH